jgi:uncharacterized glyoxalase superfamily protein PhnB
VTSDEGPVVEIFDRGWPAYDKYQASTDRVIRSSSWSRRSGDDRAVLSGLNLVVGDMARTVGFYRRLGVDMTTIISKGSHHVATVPNGFELEFDSTTLADSYDPAGGRFSDAVRNVIVFALPSRESVDTLYTELTDAGYDGHQPPYDAFWGARYAVIDDPDGNFVGLMSPSDDDYKSTPPDL